MTTAQAESTIPTGTWQSDQVHSHVGFAVKHMVVATFRGSFDSFDATLSDAAGPPKLRGVVPVESIQVRDENLNAHLLSPEFFDAERYPEIRFESIRIDREGDRLDVDGELTINDVTEQVRATGEISGPVVDVSDTEKIGIDLETKVDRTEFGLNWNAPLPKGGVALDNEVTLSVHLELRRES